MNAYPPLAATKLVATEPAATAAATEEAVTEAAELRGSEGRVGVCGEAVSPSPRPPQSLATSPEKKQHTIGYDLLNLKVLIYNYGSGTRLHPHLCCGCCIPNIHDSVFKRQQVSVPALGLAHQAARHHYLC